MPRRGSTDPEAVPPPARRLDPADAARAAALHEAAFAGLSRPWTADEIAELAAAPGAILTLLAPDDRAAPALGLLVGRALGGEAELLTLAVAPEARRRGLGRALLARFEAAAAGLGADRAVLEVDDEAAAARALYLAAGWRIVGRRRDYRRRPDGRRIDADVMEKAPSTRMAGAGFGALSAASVEIPHELPR